MDHFPETRRTPWPRQAEVPSFFGPHCNVPMKRLELPFRMKIAWDLGIGFETVRSHIDNIYNKLHVRTRTEAVVKFLGP